MSKYTLIFVQHFFEGYSSDSLFITTILGQTSVKMPLHSYSLLVSKTFMVLNQKLSILLVRLVSIKC